MVYCLQLKCGQWWATILKNVSFKAIQIHYFGEKNRIKRFNFVGQNFCHRWSDRKNPNKNFPAPMKRWNWPKFVNSLMKRHKFLDNMFFSQRWSDTVGLILCYKATFLSLFPISYIFLAMKRHNRFRNLFFEAVQRFLAFCVILICTTEENLRFIYLSMCVKNVQYY